MPWRRNTGMLFSLNADSSDANKFVFANGDEHAHSPQSHKAIDLFSSDEGEDDDFQKAQGFAEDVLQ